MVQMKSKKALTAGFLVAIIITILSFMLIAGLIFRFLSQADDKEAEILCRDSVALRASTTVNIADSSSTAAPILCKTIDKKISGDTDEVKQQMADKMARCWWMFNEGKYPSSVFDNIDLFGGENKCFICYTMLVDKIKDDKQIPSSEFRNYLATTSYPRSEGTYLEYIQQGGGPGIIIDFLDQGIRQKNGYAIAYKAKANECKVCKELLETGAAGFVLGGVGIATVGIATIPVGVLLGSGVLLGAGGVGTINDYLTENEVDAIMLVDMSEQQSWDKFQESCTLVTDIAGR